MRTLQADHIAAPPCPNGYLQSDLSGLYRCRGWGIGEGNGNDIIGSPIQALYSMYEGTLAAVRAVRRSATSGDIWGPTGLYSTR